MQRMIGRALRGGAIAALAALLPLAAAAHKTYDVPGGQYSMVVGFLNEPAYEGQQNGLDLKVTDFTKNNTGVTGLEGSLKVEVVKGSHKMPLTLEPRMGAPVAYNAYFIPTETGDYTFHIFGKIGSTAVDQSFTSSPNTFASVGPADAAEFPAKVPAVADVAQQASKAKDDASTARTLGIVGIVVGALGLVAGGLALVASRRPPAAVRAGTRPVDARP